ncbi:MAG TPA: hypothetical protein VK141_01100 [Nitrosomonas sp.]|nr:hypothetical protein [Nitrosomonas sp.]
MKNCENHLNANINCDSRRNFLMGSVALGAGAAGVMISDAASAASFSNNHFITAGVGGDFATLHEAVAAAKSLNPTSTSWVVITMMPGSYDLNLESNELALPEFIELTGVSRQGCVILGNGNKNIRISAHNRISNCTIRYTGAGSRSGAIRTQDSVTFEMKGVLDIDGIDIEVYSSFRSALMILALDRCYIRNSFIQTSGIGVEVFSGHVFISGTHCRLVGNIPGNANPHYGIKQPKASWSRIWVDGGTWATGYGSPQIDGEPGADIVMFYVGGNASSRVELNNIWCIVRNNTGANLGVKVTCVDVVLPTSWARIRGGYLQAEDLNKHEFDLENTGNGRLEIQGARYKSQLGNSYSSNGAGVRLITDAVYTPQYNDDGIKVIDASGHPSGMIVKLSAPGVSQVMGAEQVIVRIDNSHNAVIIDGNGKLINGASTRLLGSAQYSRMVLRYAGSSVGWLVTNE